MLKKIMCWTNSGGMGKSSVIRDIAAALVQHHYRVLVIDADPQANLSSYLGVNLSTLAPYETIYGTFDSASPIYQRLPLALEVHGFDLIPGHAKLNRLPMLLAENNEVLYALKDALKTKEIQQKYDFVLCDGPPTLSGIPQALAHACQSLIIPISASEKGLHSLAPALEMAANVRAGGGTLQADLIVINQFHPELSIDHQILEIIKNTLMIPTSSPLSFRAATHKKAIQEKKPIPNLIQANPCALEITALLEQLLAHYHIPYQNDKVENYA